MLLNMADKDDIITFLGVEVDERTYAEVRDGRMTAIDIQIDDNSAPSLLENIKGSLILNVDDLPDTYHGCYWRNGGKFPYIFSRNLEQLYLICDGKALVLSVSSIEAVAGERFRYGTPEHPESVPDPDGEECLWSARVSFKFLGEQSL